MLGTTTSRSTNPLRSAGLVGLGLLLGLSLGFAGERASASVMTVPAGSEAAVDFDPMKAWKRWDFLVHQALRSADVSRAQRSLIDARIESALIELDPIINDHLAYQQAMREALAAPRLDRARIESLRQAQLELADQSTRDLLDVVFEIADELTPSQRAELISWVDRFQRRMLQ